MKYLRLLIAALTLVAVAPFATAQQKKAELVKSLRLYILDCGKITGVGEIQFGFKPGQLANTEMITPCYFIAHPRGTLMWDTGEIMDSHFKAPGPTSEGAFSITQPLLPQLAALGYAPRDITYLALSHYHGDHVGGNENFGKMGVTIVAHDAVWARLSQPDPGRSLPAYPKEALPIVTFAYAVPLPEYPEFRWVLKLIELPVIEPPPPTPYAPIVGVEIAVTSAAATAMPKLPLTPVPSAVAVTTPVASRLIAPTPSTEAWLPM